MADQDEGIGLDPRELQTLLLLGQAMSAEQDPERVCHWVCESAASFLETSLAVMVLAPAERDGPGSVYGKIGDSPLPEPLAGAMAKLTQTEWPASLKSSRVAVLQKSNLPADLTRRGITHLVRLDVRTIHQYFGTLMVGTDGAQDIGSREQFVLSTLANEGALALENLRLRCEIQKANRRMQNDLAAAAKVQESLLPRGPQEIAGVKFTWAYKPCDELGGNIFNVFRLDEQHVGLYILDVSGHGAAAALLSVTLSHVLSPVGSPHSLLKQYIEGATYRLLSPAEVAEQLNRQFQMDLTTQQYFTLLYGILDLETREFRYVSAGHPGLIYLSAAEPMIVETPGLPIGLVKEVSYKERSIRMRPGDRLYLYSDGITEARNEDGEEFGTGRLINALEESPTYLTSKDEVVQFRERTPATPPAKSFDGGSKRPPFKESLACLVRSVEEWCGDMRLEDDISILALEIAQ